MKEYIYLIKWLLSRVRFLPRMYYSMLDRLLYTKSSRLMYKRVATVRNEIEHTCYYNFLGRVLFASKEIIALISHDKIFTKSIQLEGYETVDFKTLYKEGSHSILWPKSPFVELDEIVVSDAFIENISKSYYAAYDDDPNNAEKIPELSEFAKVFQNYYFDNESVISKNKLSHFRADMGSMDEIDSDMKKVLNISFILTEHLEVLSQSLGYFKSYLKSLDTVLDYHRFSDMIDHDILGSISESFCGNIKTPVYRGQRLSDRIVYLATVISQMNKHVKFSDDSRRVIVDIGGGFGHMGRFTHYYMPNSCYILVELNEMGCFGAYFLQYTFPDKKIGLYADIKDRLDEFDDLVLEYDFIVLPTWAIDAIPKEFVDLYIATSSIAELPEAYAKPYLETVDRTLKNRGYFYVNTRVTVKEHSPDVYMHYKWQLKSTFLTLSYQHHPINRMQETSPQWIGQKISTKKDLNASTTKYL